jgi:thimet oligopeptidase
MKKLPLSTKDFAWMKWTPKQMKALASKSLVHKKEVYKTLKAILPEHRTYENTVYALEQSSGEYTDVLRQISFLGEVSPKEEVRTAVHDIMMDMSKKLIDIEYDRDIYISLVEYYEGNFVDEKKKLTKEDIKLLEETVREYRRMGFDLPSATQKKLKTLLKQSSTLGEQFRKNINDYNDYILCTEEELHGLSSRFIETLPRDAHSGKYIVTLQYPHIQPFMAFATNRAKRKELAEKNLKKGGKKNLALIKQIVQLRKEIAHILGYKHHADFRTEMRMAKSGEIASKFQHDLMKKLEKPAKKDIDVLCAHARSLGIKSLEHYDLAFVANSLKKELFDVDPEALRAYFPLDHVMETMFSIYGKLFGLRFIRQSHTLWHKDATLYEVQNTDKTLVGYISFDLFPRTGKFGHAACFDTIVARENAWRSDVYTAPFTSIVCNFSPATKKTPSLLSHGEIETLFHEFGHAMHMTLSLARHESQGGANVAWDFVETPSQIMENWAWNKKALLKLSRHFQTKKALPQSMIENMIAVKKFQNGVMYMRQLIMGKLDMDAHTGDVKDMAKLYRTLTKKYTGITLPEKDTLFPAGFGHLVGYDAGYYSYLWALVYACDAFSVFEEQGTKNVLTNTVVGKRWRKEVLEKGSSEDEMKLITNFLGRKPSQKAFLKEVVG